MISIKPRRSGPVQNDINFKSFEIANGNRRVPCTLTTNFLTRDQTTRYFHANRPMLEEMARSKLLTSGLDEGKIRLVLLP